MGEQAVFCVESKALQERPEKNLKTPSPLRGNFSRRALAVGANGTTCARLFLARSLREVDSVGADLTPAQFAYLAAALSGENRQLDYRAIGIIAGGVPDSPNLVVRKECRSRGCSSRLLVFTTGLERANPSRIAQLKTADSVGRTRFAVVEPEDFSSLVSKSATSRSVMESIGMG